MSLLGIITKGDRHPRGYPRWGGRGLAFETKKPKATLRETLKKRAAYPPSAARFVGRFCVAQGSPPEKPDHNYFQSFQVLI